MEQTAVLDPKSLAEGRHAQNGIEEARPVTAFTGAYPVEMMARPGTAAVLDDVLGVRGSRLGSIGEITQVMGSGESGGWNEAEPKETIRQLLRVIGDLKAENRELKQTVERGDASKGYGDADASAQRVDRLESENANMYHLLRENRELQEQVKALQAQLKQVGDGSGTGRRSPGGGFIRESVRKGAEPLFSLGEAIEADYGEEGEYYPGKILFDHGNGTFDIAYDDGDVEKEAPARRIRRLAVVVHQNTQESQGEVSPPLSPPVGL